MIERIKSSNIFIRWTQWEYWPMWLAYLPVLPIVLYYVMRTRRWFFFSNVNPLFKTGALMGASKYKILSQIPDHYKPVTLFVHRDKNDLTFVKSQIAQAGLQFPLIAKPDVGERGILVALLQNESELQSYLKANKIDVLIQEFIDLPNECGIFYIRKPSDETGQIVSVGLKDFLKLQGDGRSTVRQLMESNSRSKLQIERMEDEGAFDFLDKVLANGESVLLEPIGNHCRGTCFSDGNHLITGELNALFNSINMHMEEVYYGRFDIKYDTWEKLLKGEDIKILEMNGIASEPIHIYDSRVRIRDKYKSFYGLWRNIYEISLIQKTRGIQPISLPMAFQAFREYKNYIKSLNSNWKQSTKEELSLS